VAEDEGMWISPLVYSDRKVGAFQIMLQQSGELWGLQLCKAMISTSSGVGFILRGIVFYGTGPKTIFLVYTGKVL
jgi:hypothetical protein